MMQGKQPQAQREQQQEQQQQQYEDLENQLVSEFVSGGSSSSFATAAFVPYHHHIGGDADDHRILDDMPTTNLISETPTLIYGDDNKDGEDDHVYFYQEEPIYRRANVEGLTSLPFDMINYEFGIDKSHGFIEQSSTKFPSFILNHSTSTSLTNLFEEDQEIVEEEEKEQQVAVVSSPCSPCSSLDAFEIPQKFHTDFLSTNPSFTSKENPFQIIQVLQETLVNTGMCRIISDDPNDAKWSIKVSTLSVAEEICFFIQLSKFFMANDESEQQQQQQRYQIDFHLLSGDEMRFIQFCEYICQLTQGIHDDDTTCRSIIWMNSSSSISTSTSTSGMLDDWMDGSKELKGKQFQIEQEEASMMLQELNTPNGLHIETLYEITKNFKDYCRHQGNRHLFYQQYYEELLHALEWMLSSDMDEIARFALFILFQYGQHQEEQNKSLVFFQRPIEKSQFQITMEKLQQETTNLWTLEFITKVFEETNLF